MELRNVLKYSAVFACWWRDFCEVAGSADHSVAAQECVDAEASVQLLQTKSSLDNSQPVVGDRACSAGYGPGMHLVQLPDVQRQFLFLVPPELAARSTKPRFHV